MSIDPTVAPPSGRAARPLARQAQTQTQPEGALKVEETMVHDLISVISERAQNDLAELNLSFLHVARELARSARDVAITRLGLDAESCTALERLSVADMHALAHSHALIFSLRVDARDLSAHAELARSNRIASEARLILAVGAA
ncbi:MAG: flagellar transcriptional regulator FlhD [Proteobacteria bacterium]|nr:flagellar transcriptional regulator FlhD [Burkholderiales bacterium]